MSQEMVSCIAVEALAILENFHSKVGQCRLNPVSCQLKAPGFSA